MMAKPGPGTQQPSPESCPQLRAGWMAGLPVGLLLAPVGSTITISPSQDPERVQMGREAS